MFDMNLLGPSGIQKKFTDVSISFRSKDDDPQEELKESGFVESLPATAQNEVPVNDSPPVEDVSETSQNSTVIEDEFQTGSDDNEGIPGDDSYTNEQSDLHEESSDIPQFLQVRQKEKQQLQQTRSTAFNSSTKPEFPIEEPAQEPKTEEILPKRKPVLKLSILGIFAILLLFMVGIFIRNNTNLFSSKARFYAYFVLDGSLKPVVDDHRVCIESMHYTKNREFSISLNCRSQALADSLNRTYFQVFGKGGEISNRNANEYLLFMSFPLKRYVLPKMDFDAFEEFIFSKLNEKVEIRTQKKRMTMRHDNLGLAEALLTLNADMTLMQFPFVMQSLDGCAEIVFDEN